MSNELSTDSFFGDPITANSVLSAALSGTQETHRTRPFKGSAEERQIEEALVKMLEGVPYVRPVKRTRQSTKQVVFGLMSTALGAPSAGSAALTMANQSVLPSFVQAEFHLSVEEGLKSLLPEIRFKEDSLLRKTKSSGKRERNPSVPPPNPLSTEGSFWASRLHQRRSGKRAEAPYYGNPDEMVPPAGTSNFTDRHVTASLPENSKSR